MIASLFPRPGGYVRPVGATGAIRNSEADMTTTASSYGLLLARVLLAFMFVLAGFGKLGDLSGTMAYTASGGIPGFLAIPATGLEIVAGLAIILGILTRPAALALAAFTVVAGFLYHYLPAQGMEGFAAMSEMNHFFKNVAIAGGFVALAAAGPGALSLDAWRGRETSQSVTA
jgi:putative oxidoreductase